MFCNPGKGRLTLGAKKAYAQTLDPNIARTASKVIFEGKFMLNTSFVEPAYYLKPRIMSKKKVNGVREFYNP